MTPSEAVQKAVVNHEFRHFAPAIYNLNSTSRAPGVMAVCWCGSTTPPFLSEKAARDAHGRHKARFGLMRSFGHWDI